MASIVSPPNPISSHQTTSTPPAVVLQNSAPPLIAVQRHRFSIAQYHEIIDHGIFAEDEPIELIRGEIVRKMPIGTSHAFAVNMLTRLLSKRLPESAMLSIQNPVLLTDSEPEPDVAVLSFPTDAYASRRPVAEDVFLLIEVADTSLAFDRDVKGPVYAEAGIVEYWIVNLNNSTVEIYRDPQPDGRFATVTTASISATLSPLKFSDVSLRVDEILVPTEPG